MLVDGEKGLEVDSGASKGTVIQRVYCACYQKRRS